MFNFKYATIIIIIFLLIIVFSLQRCNNQKTVENNILKQNEKALLDTVRISKNKFGQSEYSKNILVGDIKDLKRLNKGLYSEIVKEQGKVSEITKYSVFLRNKKQDTIFIPSTLIKYPEGVYGLKWDVDTTYNSENSRKLSGESKFKLNFDKYTFNVTPLTTIITNDIIKMNIVQGIREKDGNLEVFVRSDYPGFEVRDLNSITISPKTNPVFQKFVEKTQPKKLGVGFYGGYGLNSTGVSPQIGFGVTYSLFRF